MSYQGATPKPMEDATLIQEKNGGFCLRSLQTGESFPLAQEMLIGREVECQISLNSGHISRYHAKITRTPTGIMVEDLRSTNGTFVNGRRISQPQLLSVGDEVRFHEQAFRLVSNLEESGEADATLFQSPDSTARPAPVVPSVEPPLPSVDVQDEDNGTRVLSSDELVRLQGKGERDVRGPDNGSGPRFVVLTAPVRGKVFSLRSQQRNNWLIGRNEQCQFLLTDRTVSGEHARVRRLADDWILESCEGRNPIYINNRAVDISTLQHGDVIRIGRMELMFRTDERLVAAPQENESAVQASKINVVLVLGALITLGLVIGIILV